MTTASDDRPSVEELPDLFEERTFEFIPREWLDAAEREDEGKFFAAWKVFGRIHYVPHRCPRCGAQGVFRWGFLGRLTHGACGAEWHVGSFEYVAMRVRKATRGFAGFGGTIVGLAMLLCVELPIVLVVFLPIQALARLGDSPEKPIGGPPVPQSTSASAQHVPSQVSATDGAGIARRTAVVLVGAAAVGFVGFCLNRYGEGRPILAFRADSEASFGDRLIGDWRCDSQSQHFGAPSPVIPRFVAVRKNADGYLWTDNEGTYPASYSNGMMSVNGRPGVAYDEATRMMTCAGICRCERFRRAGSGTGAVDEFVRRSRTREATWMIATLYQRETWYFNQTGRFVAAPPTPRSDPTASGYPANAAAWSGANWRDFGFYIESAHFYQYRLDADSRGFTVTAIGDLDGDGVFSTFRRGCSLVGNGEIQGTLINITNELE